MSAEKPMTVRQAARERKNLNGPDAQALEGALSQAEREIDRLRARERQLVAALKRAEEFADNEGASAFSDVLRAAIAGEEEK